MDLSLTDEQRLIVATVRDFVERELYPHEDEVERRDEVPGEVARAIRKKAIAAGLYAPNMPAELGGGGLDAVSLGLVERELGRASYALQMLVERPSNILQACQGEQRERFLLPAIRGERHDCVAMTEPEAGSDVRSMTTAARRDGDRSRPRVARSSSSPRCWWTHQARAWLSAAARRVCPTAATTSASWCSAAAGCPRPTGSARRAAASS